MNLDEAIVDMMKYYSRELLVITMSNEAYMLLQEAGLIVDGKYDGIPVELSGEVPSDMVYVVSRDL